MRLFPRVWRLTIGTYDLSRLRMTFKVKSSLKQEPNTCDVDVYNLSPNTRAQLETAATPNLRLEAGYDGHTTQIFLGQVRTCYTEVADTDRVTKFSSGDGEKAVMGTRVRKVYSAQVSINNCIRDIANVLGLGVGNLDDITKVLSARGVVTLYPRGVTLNGNAWRELQTICRASGVECTIQDGALLLLQQGQARQGGPIIQLSATTGLEGSPTADNDGSGTVNAKARLIPGLRPGALVSIDSLSVKGVFRIYDAEYSGDTHGEDWSVAMSLQRVVQAYVPQVIEL